MRGPETTGMEREDSTDCGGCAPTTAPPKRESPGTERAGASRVRWSAGSVLCGRRRGKEHEGARVLHHPLLPLLGHDEREMELHLGHRRSVGCDGSVDGHLSITERHAGS